MHLTDRMKTYEDGHDFKIMAKVPIIIKSEISNFNKITRKLNKPYCKELWRILQDTLKNTIMDIDGAVFGTTHNGEFIFVLKSDADNDSQFCSNKVQRLSSRISSLITSNFMKFYLASDSPPDIIGETVFETNSFGIPNLVETMNYLLWRQQSYFHYSIKHATFHELSKLYQIDAVNSMIEGCNHSRMKDLLELKCNIIFEERYPVFFRRGSICYKIPKIVKIENENDIVRNKWNLDLNTLDFLDEEGRDFVMNILHTGRDSLRPERDILKD